MKKREPRIEFFPGKDGKFYWHAVGANGQITMGGTQGYTRMVDAQRAFGRNMQQARTALELGRVFDHKVKFK